MLHHTIRRVFIPESNTILKTTVFNDREFQRNAARFAFIMGYRTNAELQRFLDAYDEALRCKYQDMPDMVSNG
jgi:hypothetical protein